MKRFFFFLFLFLWISCSRIGFEENSYPQSPSSHYQDSTLCSPDSRSDSCSQESINTHQPFFRIGREEIRPGYLTEYFKISHRDKLEIIMVLDVSRSMDNNLKKTGQNMMALLSHIQHKKWRMAFITADHGDHTPYEKGNRLVYTQDTGELFQGNAPMFGKFMHLEKRGKILDQVVLQYDTPQYAQIFKDTLTREDHFTCHKAPYCQGPNEQPLRSLQSTFKRYLSDRPQKQFFKENTDTVAIIITDEDERGQDVENATTANQVISTFKQVFKGQKKRLFGFSISIQDKECYEKEGSIAYGRRVGRLADLTLGRDFWTSPHSSSGNISLCSKDYGQALEGISQITRAVTESLTLEKIFFIPETVDIQLSPSQPEVSWRFYGRKLVFSNNIRPGTKIRVSYRYENY